MSLVSLSELEIRVELHGLKRFFKRAHCFFERDGKRREEDELHLGTNNVISAFLTVSLVCFSHHYDSI